jgi:hypothetical protein
MYDIRPKPTGMYGIHSTLVYITDFTPNAPPSLLTHKKQIHDVLRVRLLALGTVQNHQMG